MVRTAMIHNKAMKIGWEVFNDDDEEFICRIFRPKCDGKTSGMIEIYIIRFSLNFYLEMHDQS